MTSHVGDAPSIGSRAASSALDWSQGLTWLPAWQLAKMIAKRDVSSVEVVRHFVTRIEEHDPELHAFRTVNAKEALAQAEQADRAAKTGDQLGPLHGVPIAFKELFAVKGFPVPGVYSSYLSDGRHGELPIAERDDVEVERLRAAGAIVVGVTVAALGPTPGMPNPTHLPRNPWKTSHTSGGSSAGNAAAVAGGLLPMAIGDDGGGSVRVPSAFCGLLGLAPTRGRVPHVDYKSAAPRPTVTVGPMTRSVEDAAIALHVLAAPDGRDFVCLQDTPPDYLDALCAGVGGKRFLWTESFGSPLLTGPLESPRTVSAIRAAAGMLERLGGTVEETTVAWEDPLRSWVAAQQLSGIDIASWFERGLSEKEMVDALDTRDRNWRRSRQVFSAYDFLVSPTVQFTAPKMDAWIELCTQLGGRPKHMLALDSLPAHTMMCNVLGIPAISIPAGFEDGMPIGLQVIGKPGSERDLLQVAQALLTGQEDDDSGGHSPEAIS